LSNAIDGANSPAPAQEYMPMGNAFAEKEPEKEIHNSDAHGLREAAAEVDKQRQEVEPTERKYIRYGGSEDGKHVPLNETISINRAAEDLTRIRNQEQQAEENINDHIFAAHTDGLRQGYTPEQVNEALVQQAQQQLQPEQQQQAQVDLQPQPEAQPELPAEVREL